MTNSHQRILMVYPEFPRTYWGMEYILPLVGKKSAMLPLGLITIAALTPPEYEIRLVDLNCGPLSEDDIDWAEIVCFSAMLPQKKSLFETAERCRGGGRLVVFGGPLPMSCPEECAPYCDVLVLSEGEVTWPLFLRDLERGTVQPVYTSDEKPDVTQTPVPRFDLLDVHDYVNVPIQFSRGCPFQCEFCDIIVLFGRTPRTKTPQQVLAELDAVCATGYRGGIFMVDDNFVSNKKEVKKLLPELRAWNEAHGHPFYYGTQASVDMAHDSELLDLMVAADFLWVYMGVESASIESLKETRKYQNIKKGSLLDSVMAVQRAGLMVYAGFILGFDHDPEDIFDRQLEFIHHSAVPLAGVALLYALPGTPLHSRMEHSGRLRSVLVTDDFSGFDTNFETLIPRRRLLEGHRRMLATVYAPREYFRRTLEAFCRLPRRGSMIQRMLRLFWLTTLMFKKLFSNWRQRRHTDRPARFSSRDVIRCIWDIPARFKWESVKFMMAILLKRPDQLIHAMLYVLMGIHVCRFCCEDFIPDIERRLAQLPPGPNGGKLKGAGDLASPDSMLGRTKEVGFHA